MFGKKKKKTDLINFISDNYQMKDIYNADNLVVANLEYISDVVTPYGPKDEKTSQKYIFETLIENGKIRYREIFTGFIADKNNNYFNLPYVVDVISLKELMPSIVNEIPKYSLLLILNDINSKDKIKKLS